ncbi:MAG: hypothetical protein WD851_17115 [Pirellulales bacterium]
MLARPSGAYIYIVRLPAVALALTAGLSLPSLWLDDYSVPLFWHNVTILTKITNVNARILMVVVGGTTE